MNWNQLREMDRLYLHRFSSTGKHLAFILCLLCLASSTLPNGQAEPLAEQQATNWIWVGPREGTHANILFKRQFSVSHDQTTANLKFAPCFACLRVKVDGILVGIASPYQGMKEIELGHSLSAGSHALTVEAMGVEGPSAFFIELMLANSGHASTIIRSNTNWTASSRSTSNQARLCCSKFCVEHLRGRDDSSPAGGRNCERAPGDDCRSTTVRRRGGC